MKVATRLEDSLAAINEESRSAAKKAGWELFKKYAYPILIYGTGFATAHYWPNLAPLLALLKGQ